MKPLSSDGRKFWEVVALKDMSATQWESLCDGCGKCCLHKLQDADTADVYYTNIGCQYLNKSGQCSAYTERLTLVADCINVTADNVSQFFWLPTTCAYRLVHEGKPLPEWHHLVCGDKLAVHNTGNSVKGAFISELRVNEQDYEDYIIHWIH